MIDGEGDQTAMRQAKARQMQQRCAVGTAGKGDGYGLEAWGLCQVSKSTTKPRDEVIPNAPCPVPNAY